jgi:hypothetical protein
LLGSKAWSGAEGFFSGAQNFARRDGNSDRLGPELTQLIRACAWFDVLRFVRDSIVHEGARPMVFPGYERITFQVYAENVEGLQIEALMFNESLVDFELYAGVLIGQTIGFSRS